MFDRATFDSATFRFLARPIQPPVSRTIGAMISPLWWVPLITVAAAIVPLWLVARRLDQELTALGASAERLRLVRSVLGDVKAQIIAARRSLEDLARQ
jgi:hypothetical protein